MSKLGAILIAVVAFSSGCTSSRENAGDPKAQLRDYISASFNAREAGDRQKLMSFMTGGAKTRLAAWSDEQFKQAFIENKRQFIKLAFREVKPVSAKETSITYELTYLDQGKGHDAKVTNKKLCQLVNESGRWLISEVKTLKELVEYRNEMSLP
jgi:hypothetical protein